MKKSVIILVVILVLVLIGTGLFYFFYLAPSSETLTSQSGEQIARVDTTFDLTVLDKLDSFVSHGNFPIVVNPNTLRKNNPAQADPFFN